jgi:choline kinase
MLGILPCAGTASRLFNLPKFMLPTKKEQCSLIVYWINLLIKNKCNKIIIGVSENTKIFIDNILKYNLNEDIKNIINIKLVGNTNTMNETIIACLKDENYEMAIMGMPDTYVSDLSHILIENINKENINVGCYLWNIRDTQKGKIGQCNVDDNFIVDIIDKDTSCDYIYGWGVVVFKPEFEKYIYMEDLHIGYSMKRYIENNKIIYQILNDGLYFDCGTTLGYTEYLNYMEDIKPTYIKGTIIIIAVYINNELNTYNELVKCLTQLRSIYANEIIVAIDNGSLNNKWYEVANKLNINILYNNSVLHRYEIGAYKLALQHFRADTYIFIQGTIFINNRLDLSPLNSNEEKAISFDIIENNLSWSDDGLNFINKLLRTINMSDWNKDPLILWNCFACNNIFINNILNSGIFDLPSNTKAHSCAFERILGCYFKKTLKEIKCIDRHSFRKIFLNQDPIIL